MPLQDDKYAPDVRAAPLEEASVSTDLNHLTGQISDLDEILGMLERRLARILVPGSDEIALTKPELGRHSSDVGQVIIAQTERIRAAVERARALYRRLDLPDELC